MQGIRGANAGSQVRVTLSVFAAMLVLLAISTQVFAQAIPQKNVNAIGPGLDDWLYVGNPRMQQNEADGIESSVYPGHLAIGFNDYRGVNDPSIGEAFPGIAMSSDGGKTWKSGLHPWHYGDIPSLGQKGGADANLEYVPHLMLYNFIAFWRDASQPGGVYLSRWYEHNREVGPPFEFLDIQTINTGNTNKFLDKPSFRAALRNPDDGLPDILLNIPAYVDPRNPANFHDAYVQNVPANRLHLCYSVFVGNDNNDGTKIECMYSDDGGVTWPGKQKISESVEINQGTSIATRNFGQEVLVAWTRFEDNNETAAVMYALSTDFGNSFSKPAVISEFCPFNQSTGAARFRTNALPVAVSAGNDFGVYIASRNNATETCLIRAKGNKPEVPRMSAVDPIDDFDSFGETPNADGSRNKDGKVRTSLNFSRIMMTRSSPAGNGLNWSIPVMIDPQVDSQGRRKRGHQFMPACDAAGGIETCTWYDSRLDKLNLMPKPLTGGYVEDLVLHLEPGVAPSTQVSAVVLPAGVYDVMPPLPGQPPNTNNVPLRRNLDVFAAQIENGTPRPYTVDPGTFYATVASDPSMEDNSPSIRVSRFATIQDPNGPVGTRKQAEWNFANARLFRKGKASFIGDYNTVFAAPARLRLDGKWTSNQSAPNPAVDLFSSQEPIFTAGWTSNHNVRGKVFYTGCDVWNESLQMWEAGPGCASTYTDPDTLMMIPLQGEDGTVDGPPLTCTIASTMGMVRSPLTRNQNIYTAAMVPGISARVVSAIKRPEGKRNSFVLNILNGSKFARTVNINLPAASMLSFGVDGADSILSIPVVVPAGSGNTRTVFDFGNLDTDPGLADSVIVTVTDESGSEVLANVPLLRTSLAPLENVQTNDPDNLIDLVGAAGSEFYQLILKREIGLSTGASAPTLDLENLDLENTALMLDLENLDLENLDLENKVVFLDLENLDLENLDLENSLYTNLDLENRVINLDLENLDLENRLLYLDLENLDLENLDLENLDLENLDLENLDLENLDLENLDLENLDLENLDLENLDLENLSIFAADVENLDLENLDLENVAPGDAYTEISWTADSATNTTTGVDIRPIFSATLAENLASSGATVLLTVRRSYMNSTVASPDGAQFCAPQVVVDNQILYASRLSPDQLLQSAFLGSVSDPDPMQADTPGFVISPDESTIITMRFVNLPAGFDLEALSANSGLALFSQPGGTVDCDVELPGDEADPACEVDFIEPDMTPPVITLLGLASLTLEAGVDTYTEQGATALDDRDGDITSSIVTGGDTVDAGTVGTYVVTYDVSDAALNPAAQVTRTVIVQDTTTPVITLNGATSVTLEAGVDSYTELGATASDIADGIVGVTIGGDVVNDAVPGIYVVTYDASDSSGNGATQLTRTVTVQDTTAPVITLVGAATMTLEVGVDSYIDPGATASDIADGDLSGSIVIGGDSVDAMTVGTYVVTYDVSDAATNAAIQIIRTITVQDTTAPVITLLGDNPLSLEAGDAYVEPGAAAADAGDSAVLIVIDSAAVNTALVGSYNVNYDATDASGNTAARVTRTVTVTDNSVPVIGGINPPLFNPPAPFVLPPGDTTFVIDWPVGATDPNPGLMVYCDIGIPPTRIYPTVSSSGGSILYTFTYPFGPGTTAVTCAAIDQGGNSDSGTFTVTVEDVPVIDTTSLPTQPFTVEANGPAGYVGPTPWSPITATDLIDGSIIASCTPDSSLALGTNSISCVATDSAGNSSLAVTFPVVIEDSTAPTAAATDDPFVILTNDVPATVFEAEMEANVTGNDVVDGTNVDIACSLPGDGDSITLALGIHADVATCTVSDQSGNESTITFDVEIRFAYDIVVLPLKGNIKAGSTVPLDWYYNDAGTSNRANTSSFSPMVNWYGPFSDRNCTTGSNGSGDGSAAEDSGSSDFRYSGSNNSWRLNWQTPSQAGYYNVVIAPPGTAAATQCVRTR
jgi:uncharacterized protein YjbI with pentapeptide repeats